MIETLVALMVFALMAMLAAPVVMQLSLASRAVEQLDVRQRELVTIDRFLAAVAREARAGDIQVEAPFSQEVRHHLIVVRSDTGPQHLEWRVDGVLRRRLDLSGDAYSVAIAQAGPMQVLELITDAGRWETSIIQPLYLSAPRDCHFSEVDRDCLPAEAF